MTSNMWIKKTMTILMAIAMLAAIMASSSPASAAVQTAGQLASQPTADNATALSQPLVAGDELWSNKFMLGTDNSVFVIAVAPNGDIYIGGSFTHVAGISANRVAKWTASTNHWSALGSGVNNYVSALTLSGNFLFVGGVFSSAGGNPANAVASYDLAPAPGQI